MNLETAAQCLVRVLAINNTKKVFSVPGESYLAVLDALYEAQLPDDTKKIDVITCRQESGASNMANTYGKLTGEPGICFVTRGPGPQMPALGSTPPFRIPPL